MFVCVYVLLQQLLLRCTPPSCPWTATFHLAAATLLLLPDALFSGTKLCKEAITYGSLVWLVTKLD